MEEVHGPPQNNKSQIDEAITDGGYQAYNTYMFSRMFWTNHRRITRKLIEEVHKNGQSEHENLTNGLKSLENLIWCFVRNVVRMRDYLWIHRSVFIF